MDFFTTGVPITFWSDHGHYRSKADINWHLEFDARDWGVKDIYPYLTGNIKFDIERESEDENIEPETQEVNIDVSTIEPEISYVKSYGISPIGIEIEQNQGKVISIKCQFGMPQ